MHIRLTDLELRQVILGGTTLLLILVHMVAPGAGVDAVSIILLAFLALVLYGDELTGWLARVQQQRHARPSREAELPARVREVAYHVEHARVAGSTDGVTEAGPVGERLERILERADGQPRAALLLLWATLEDRLLAANGASGGAADGLSSARKLAEQGRVPQQFVDAYAAFRALRNDVARAAEVEVTDDLLWSLIDVGGALLALTPTPHGTMTRSEGMSR
ncbi:MAG: hypothetical protein R6V07_12150 [Armatimonadota bacterium]